MAEDKKKFEEKTIKSKVFGEIQLGANGEYSISNQDLFKFYEEHGLPNAKEVLDAEVKAKNALVEEVVKFTTPEVIKRKDDVTFNAGIGAYRMEVTQQARTENNNPQTRELVVSYGKVRVKNCFKVPKCMTDAEGVIGQAAAEIAKALSK